MRRRASGGRAALRPPGEWSGGTGPAAGRRPVRLGRRASGEQVHCARPETVGRSGPATGRRPARRREPGDRAHCARPANGRVCRAGHGPTVGGGDEQSAIRCARPESGLARRASSGREGACFRRSGALRPPGERSTSPGRQRADGWRRGAVPAVGRAAPARRVRRRVRAGGRPMAGGRVRTPCRRACETSGWRVVTGPAAAAVGPLWQKL